VRAWFPSPGFIVVFIVYGLVAAFFSWGLSTPDLDRVWTLHHELKIGSMKRLKDRDRALLGECMARYPDLAKALLDGEKIGVISANTNGWIAAPTATVLRTPESEGRRILRLQVQTPKDLLPYIMVIQGNGAAGTGWAWRKELEVDRQGFMDVVLPEPPATSEIVEVRLKGNGFKPDPSVLGVRIEFPMSSNVSSSASGPDPEVDEENEEEEEEEDE